MILRNRLLQEHGKMVGDRELVARLLIDIGAPHFFTDKPFVFTSGTISPVYVDLRKLISFPKHRKAIMAVATALCTSVFETDPIDVVAGGETAGISYAAWLSNELNLPMIYVRKQPKGFGRKSQIEGDLKPGQHVLLIEDLMFDAQSKLNFAEVIRQEGARIGHTVVVFDYGTAVSRQKLASANMQVHGLTDWTHLLKVGEERGYFSPEQAREIRLFLADPAAWGTNWKQQHPES
jgi:orotate phosphoribosyltransferase